MDDLDFSQKKTIKTKIVSIYGLPGEGKTFFAVFLASFYNRIYSNVDIYRWKKKINNTINSLIDIENIKYSNDRGVLIIDEWGANNNSRTSLSENNRIFWRLAMYCRKYNIDIIMISQLERMQDVYYREMSYFHFEMNSFFNDKWLMFEVWIKNRFNQLISIKSLDLIRFSNKYKITYNSLDKSLISN